MINNNKLIKICLLAFLLFAILLLNCNFTFASNHLTSFECNNSHITSFYNKNCYIPVLPSDVTDNFVIALHNNVCTLYYVPKEYNNKNYKWLKDDVFCFVPSSSNSSEDRINLITYTLLDDNNKAGAYSWPYDDYSFMQKTHWSDSSTASIVQGGFEEHLFYHTLAIYNFDKTVYWEIPMTDLAKIFRNSSPTNVLKETISILGICLAVLISYISIRKGIRFLVSNLRNF